MPWVGSRRYHPLVVIHGRRSSPVPPISLLLEFLRHRFQPSFVEFTRIETFRRRQVAICMQAGSGGGDGVEQKASKQDDDPCDLRIAGCHCRSLEHYLCVHECVSQAGNRPAGTYYYCTYKYILRKGSRARAGGGVSKYPRTYVCKWGSSLLFCHVFTFVQTVRISPTQEPVGKSGFTN